MMTLLIIAVTVIVSFISFKNYALLDRLMFWTYAVKKKHQYDRFLTHGFVHADTTHLLFNMITLFFFGQFAEREVASHIGEFGFLLFYLSAIVVAMIPTYLRHGNDMNYRSLGASGAVSATTMMFAFVNPWKLIFVFFIPVPAIVYALLFVGYSIWKDRTGGDNTNHNAHLSGAIYGVLFLFALDPAIVGEFMGKLMRLPFSP